MCIKLIVGYYNVLGTMISEHIDLLPAMLFQFHLEERWCMDVQTRHDISTTVGGNVRLSYYCVLIGSHICLVDWRNNG